MSDKPSVKPGLKAIAYAENDLGVHRVAEAAEAARDKLDAALTDLATRRDMKRVIEEQIADLEIDLYSDERGKHADLSQAALERHMKVVLAKDPQLIEARSRLGNCVSEIEGLGYDVQVIEADIKIAVARMTELGGYLNFLAAVKQAENTKHTEMRSAQHE